MPLAQIVHWFFGTTSNMSAIKISLLLLLVGSLAQAQNSSQSEQTESIPDIPQAEQSNSADGSVLEIPAAVGDRIVDEIQDWVNNVLITITNVAGELPQGVSNALLSAVATVSSTLRNVLPPGGPGRQIIGRVASKAQECSTRTNSPLRGAVLEAGKCVANPINDVLNQAKEVLVDLRSIANSFGTTVTSTGITPRLIIKEGQKLIPVVGKAGRGLVQTATTAPRVFGCVFPKGVLQVATGFAEEIGGFATCLLPL